MGKINLNVFLSKTKKYSIIDFKFKKITVAELVESYEDNAEGGVIGCGGKLDIRPPYQREFIYKAPQRDAVIDILTKNFPLNVTY